MTSSEFNMTFVKLSRADTKMEATAKTPSEECTRKCRALELMCTKVAVQNEKQVLFAGISYVTF